MITTLQARLKTLLETVEAAAFTGVEILTDERPDFVSAVAQVIGRQDLVVAIGFADGEAAESARPTQAILTERIRISIIQHRLHTAHSAVTLLEAAMRAVHNAPQTSGDAGPLRFFVQSHRTDVDEEGTRVCELFVRATLVIR